MRYRIIHEITGLDTGKWEFFNRHHPEFTIFQSPVMFSYYSSLEHAEPVFLAVLDEHDALAGILLGVLYHDFRMLPDFLGSRIVIYGGPLIDPACSNKEMVLSMILESLRERWSGTTFFIQIRNFFSKNDFAEVYRKHDFAFVDHLNLVLDTTNTEKIQAGISKSKLRQVRKGMENGATVEPAKNVEEVRSFYRILSSLYSKKVKKPLPSLQFFEEFFSFTQRQGLGVILLTKKGSEVIGGMVCPVTPGKRMFEWYVCGLDRDYRELYPSVLVTYSAIQYAASHSIPEFDFMGLGQPGQKYGVREFKSRFGGQILNTGRYLRINNRFIYRVAGTGYRIFSFLKII